MSKQFDKQFKENAVQYYLAHKELGCIGMTHNILQYFRLKSRFCQSRTFNHLS